MNKSNGISTKVLYKIFIYVTLIALAVTIIIPVTWVFFASIKENVEFYVSPWALSEGFYFQNFVEAFRDAHMGDYLLNSLMVTALDLFFLLFVDLPAAYVLSRFKFLGSRFLNSFFKVGLFINVSYIAVPLFLMLLGWDLGIKEIL